MRGFLKKCRFAPLLAGAFFFFAAPFFAASAQRGGGPEGAGAAYAVCAAAEKRETGRVPKGVTVDGVPVGGMPKRRAERLLRGLLEGRNPVLVVISPAGRYSFAGAEIGFSDNFREILAGAEKGGSYASEIRYFLKGEAEQAEFICANARRPAVDAEVRFSAAGFSYTAEQRGTACDGEGLLRDIRASLAAGPREEGGEWRFAEVSLRTRALTPEKTLASLKRDTKKISSFATYFNAEDRGRSGNIALAASRIDGTVLPPQGEFSFNAAVGERTEKNGFQTAKVILDGEFVSGVGGGVCQVSTTLYNAAIRAGMKITARKPHSLAVHYVPPSCDAMVSSATDFRFRNTRPYPVYLSAKVSDGSIRIAFYGREEGYRYELISQTLGEIEPPPPVEKTGNYEGVIREGKPGLKSTAYLETYKNGKLIRREKLRTDTYAPIRGIVGVLREGTE